MKIKKAHRKFLYIGIMSLVVALPIVTIFSLTFSHLLQTRAQLGHYNRNNVIDLKWGGRLPERYVLQSILDYSGNDKKIHRYRNFILDKLDITDQEWKNNPNSSGKYVQDAKKILQDTKQFLTTPADNQKQTIFENFKSNRVFRNLDEIEDDINNYLQYGSSQSFRFSRIAKKLDEKSWQKLKNVIVEFYNFLVNSRIFSKSKIVKLLFTITSVFPYDQEEGVNAEVYAETTYTQAMMGIYFNESSTSKWYDANRVEEEFKTGWTVSPYRFKTIIHEFGHIIHNYYALNSEQKMNLNRPHFTPEVKGDIAKQVKKIYAKHSQDEEDKFYEKFADGKNMIVGQAYDFISEKIHPQSITDKLTFEIAKLTAVPSEYGRSQRKNPRTNEYPQYSREWFAEGFAYYYLTPAIQRNKIWEFWHDFFTQKLITLK